MPAKPSILVIDDEENLRRTLVLILEREGYQVQPAATMKEALQLLESSAYDLAFLDLVLPDANGLLLLPELTRQFPDMPVLVLTALDRLESAIEAIQKGARDYLLKPIDPPMIIQHVKDVLAEKKQPRSARERVSQLQGLLKELRLKDEPNPPPPKKTGT